jgi:hypothetical protein
MEYSQLSGCRRLNIFYLLIYFVLCSGFFKPEGDWDLGLAPAAMALVFVAAYELGQKVRKHTFPINQSINRSIDQPLISAFLSLIRFDLIRWWTPR